VTIFPRGFGVVRLLISNKQLYSKRYMRVAAVVRKVATGKGVESTKDTLSMFYNRLNGK